MLELEAINTYRGRAQITQQLSLTVGEAETVCLVGPNGAGKTPTIDSIIGLLPIRSGKITFRGKVISGLAPHLRARHGIGYAPEDAGLFPDLTVAENIEICRWLAEDSGRAEQAGVSPDARIYPLLPQGKASTHPPAPHISGGQKKMAPTSRAIGILSPSPPPTRP